MSVLVASPTPAPSPVHDHSIPRKRTSSFSFPLRPAKAPRLHQHHTMGSVQTLRRTESFASLSELLLEAVSTPSSSKFSKQPIVSTSASARPTTTPASTAPSPTPKEVKEPKEIPYTRTLQYQQDQRLARRRKAHALTRCDTTLLDLSVPIPLSSALSLSSPSPAPTHTHTPIQTPTPIPVAAQLVKEPVPLPVSVCLLSPAPQRKSPSSRRRGSPSLSTSSKSRVPSPPSLSPSSPSSPLSSSPFNANPKNQQRRKSPPRHISPQVILPSASSPHAIPILLTPRSTSPLHPSGPHSAPGRPVFPRSKRTLCLLRIACMRRMEEAEEGGKGRGMRTMGVRGAVEVWRATRELEEMLSGGGDEMDVDAEGDTDEEEEADPFRVDVDLDVEIQEPTVASEETKSVQEVKEPKMGMGKGKALERQGSLLLSSSWVVVPGEDWEMVDC